jgi:lantibiotic modifying enzyme
MTMGAPIRVVPARRALAIARSVADRMFDPATVAESASSLRFEGSHRNGRWAPAALADGLSGPLLLFAALEEVTGEDQYARALARHVSYVMERAHKNWTLFGGWAGFAFVLRTINRQDRFTPVLDLLQSGLNSAMDERRMELCDTKHSEVDYAWDVISGLSGLVIASNDSLAVPACCDAIKGWIVSESVKPEADAGVAHGVCGALAALLIGGVPRDLLVEAFSAAYGMAMTHFCKRRWDGDTSDGFSAWCRGELGMAGILRSAARELGIATPELDEHVANGIRAFSTWTFVDNGICHGRSGTALVLASAFDRTDVLDGIIGTLVRGIIDGYDDAYAFGFRFAFGPRSALVDGHDLLNGATGCALALLTLTGRTDARWLRAFGLPAR